MNVSVIIPAYNAAKTLADTLKSLQAQTSHKWEAIVVDDGSRDDTAVIASRFAQQDRRIRFVRQQNSGPCVARNAGIRLAHFDWLLFLDADDWIGPTHLQLMTEKLAADPRLDAVHCGSVYVTPDGTLSEARYGDASCDLFPTLACHCAFPIHACIVRKAIVEAVGGWDPSLTTCEDWDLWQRIARTGAKFGIVKKVLTFYRMQPKSLSRRANQLFLDAMRVLAQGHSLDPRVPNPHPRYRDGQPQEALPKLRLYMASWVAGLILGEGKDAQHLLKLIEDVPIPDLDPYGVADCLFDSVPLALCELPTAWSKIWPSVERCSRDFLVALDALSKAPGLAGRTIGLLTNQILGQTEITDPLNIGTTHAVRLEATEPIPDIRPPTGMDRLFCTVLMEGTKLGELELPVIDGLVASWVLKDAIAAQFAWAIFDRFFEHNIYSKQKVNEHDRMGWKVFWQQLWGCPDWAAGHDHDSEAKDKLAHAKRVNSDRLIVEVSDELFDLYTVLPEVKIGFTVGGVPLGVVTVPVNNNLIKASTLRVALARAGRFELCRACVREALVGKPLREPTTLRARLAEAALARARQSDQFGIGLVSSQAVVLGGRPGYLGTSVSRRALLPRKVGSELVKMAQIAGEPVLQSPSVEKPDRILYAPELIDHLFWQKQASRSSLPRFSLPRWAWFLKRALKSPGLVKALRNLKRAYADNLRKLPILLHPRMLSMLSKYLIFITPSLIILMYHRVAPCNGSEPKRYLVTPEAFEEQLRYLRDAGFHNIALDDWLVAMVTGRPLPGRAIAFTFDDGYQDFYEYAFPLLKRYGYSATVSLVTDYIDGWNHWDEAYGKKVRLMGWQEIHQLKDEGVLFASHSVSHRPLTSLSPADMAQEGAKSRALLEQELGVPVKTFVYPYGDFDPIVEHIIGACGYTTALSTQGGLGHLGSGPLALPRFEVMGTDTFQDFVTKLTYSFIHSFKFLLPWIIDYGNEANGF